MQHWFFRLSLLLHTLILFFLSNYRMSSMGSSSQSGTLSLTFTKKWDSTDKTSHQNVPRVSLFWWMTQCNNLIPPLTYPHIYLFLHPSILLDITALLKYHIQQSLTPNQKNHKYSVETFLQRIGGIMRMNFLSLQLKYKLAIHTLQLIICTFKQLHLFAWF